MRTTQMDPAEARWFVAKLNENCREMAHAMAGIRTDWSALFSHGWDDEKASQFGHALEDSIKVLVDFLNDAEGYADQLSRMAQHIQAFQDR
jgi:hypothetical protein